MGRLKKRQVGWKLTGGRVTYKQGDEVGDRWLAFGEVMQAAGSQSKLLCLFSRW